MCFEITSTGTSIPPDHPANTRDLGSRPCVERCRSLPSPCRIRQKSDSDTKAAPGLRTASAAIILDERGRDPMQREPPRYRQYDSISCTFTICTFNTTQRP
ncbi:hypothetical protein GWI33_008867 [Rhynchophorus ferrugineus]|uniref:Uncharacterized protein n=1 Tax=Rhynchophorus ferrugineus TaxID=354439 RepID=A0A834IE84_RHYFE|nr:hypothetical protein GWI33_008867 [Rhynchophorus ferrugineus]